MWTGGGGWSHRCDGGGMGAAADVDGGWSCRCGRGGGGGCWSCRCGWGGGLEL